MCHCELGKDVGVGVGRKPSVLDTTNLWVIFFLSRCPCYESLDDLWFAFRITCPFPPQQWECLPISSHHLLFLSLRSSNSFPMLLLDPSGVWRKLQWLFWAVAGTLTKLVLLTGQRATNLPRQHCTVLTCGLSSIGNKSVSFIYFFLTKVIYTLR